MRTILIAGAGKSSIYLIQYLLSIASRNKWKVVVADGNKENIESKINGNPFAEAAVIDITKNTEREALVKRADMVVSLMPPHLHILLAKDCLKHKKNLITSSYISPEMKEMDKAVKEAGLIFMCEMGLDPGIDHMTASQIIHSIQRVASVITSFKSYCGGLIAPECDNNPWHYKFTWNPKNIITAGADGARYLSHGKEVDVPYSEIFKNNKKIKVDDLGSLAYYPNRDSMRYLELYDIPEVKTFMRATLRHPGFCKGWEAIVALGLTNNQDTFDAGGQTLASWLKNKSGYHNTISLQEHISQKLELPADSKVISMLEWLGLFDEIPLKKGKTNSADLLLGLLSDKWKMQPAEKDMVVMQHEVEYIHKERKIKLTSSMVLKGENSDYSAMAKTVGLPMAILAKLLLNKKVSAPAGVNIPNMPSVYRPVLTELHHHGINFKEEVE
ncbi:MAG: saccharopine dehydrogenase NADP-binding domain-containing protein [Bacteroidetes bacterium]|nr:saccharopine dehydrogenase NADP-binding domain-containing protein [Bacteroidota bacterium]